MISKPARMKFLSFILKAVFEHAVIKLFMKNIVSVIFRRTNVGNRKEVVILDSPSFKRAICFVIYFPVVERILF